jgi:DNA repair exonuclease SbcCD ATPase subunit
MFCSECGEKRISGKFCSSCGTEFPNEPKKVVPEEKKPTSTDSVANTAENSSKEPNPQIKNLLIFLSAIAAIILVIAVAISSQQAQQVAEEKATASEEAAAEAERDRIALQQSANQEKIERVRQDREACSKVDQIHDSLTQSAKGASRVSAAPIFASSASQIRVAVTNSNEVKAEGTYLADMMDKVASSLQLDYLDATLSGQLVQAKLDFDNACSNLN